MRADALPLIGVLAVVFAVYLPTLDDYFHGDDFLAFIDLTTLPALRQVGDVFTFSDSNIYWRPLGHVYFLAIYGLAGLDPFSFHLGNLVVFLLTLVCLYRFVVRAGLGRNVGLGAVALLGLLPNHVVSVAWTTNGPRLLAVLFALVCLLLIQESLRSRRRYFEVPALLAMVASVLSDEVAVALTPLPVLYAVLAQPGSRPWALQHLLRAGVYGGFGLAITVLQLTVGMDGQTRAPAVLSLNEVAFGAHILREYWALTAKLVLPLTDGVGLAGLREAQWVAGGLAAAAAAALLVAGTPRVRFLVVWAVIALAPFTLWTAPIAPARYTYMAAVPFAVLASWAVVALARSLMATPLFAALRRLNLAPAAGVLAAVVVVGLGAVAGKEIVARNDAFAREAAPYRVLAEQLPRALPTIASNSRLVIYYGVWRGSFVWQDAVVQTIYRDRTLKTLNVDRSRTESSMPATRPNDVVVFYTERGFIVPPTSRR